MHPTNLDIAQARGILDAMADYAYRLQLMHDDTIAFGVIADQLLRARRLLAGLPADLPAPLLCPPAEFPAGEPIPNFLAPISEVAI